MRKAIDESKVQRMRNLVSGNYTAKTKIRIITIYIIFINISYF